MDANRSILSDVPLFDQASVHTRMLNFHCKLAAARETVQDRRLGWLNEDNEIEPEGSKHKVRKQLNYYYFITYSITFMYPRLAKTSFRIIHIIGTHTHYARPNDIYVTLVITLCCITIALFLLLCTLLWVPARPLCMLCAHAALLSHVLYTFTRVGSCCCR